MKNKNVIACGISIMLVITLIVNLDDTKSSSFKKDGIIYSLLVDGNKQNNFPSKGMYRVDTECTNAKCKWDYEGWKLYLEEIEGDVSCNISFTTITKKFLNNSLVELSGTTQGTGQVVNEKGYRYQGQDPNNYIWFNNEMWRIIGVFGSESHGVANTNLVKIIREVPIGGLAWDKSSTDNWSTSSLKLLLNGEYLNSQNGTNGNYCYGKYEQAKAKCDYTETGIKSAYKGMIKEVTWYLGGFESAKTTPDLMYGYERGNEDGGNPKKDSGKIGLMYASDYGYAVPSKNCARTTQLYSYSNSCVTNNWLYGHGFEWLITNDTSWSSGCIDLTSRGHLSDQNTGIGYSVRPVLYLDSSVYVLDGDGSEADPYIIAM